MNLATLPTAVLALLVAAGVALIVAGVAAVLWYRRIQPGAEALSLLSLAGAGWSSTYAVTLLNSDPSLELTLWKLGFSFVVVVPLLWFEFTLRYTGQGRSVPRSWMGGLLAVAAGIVLLAWTNESHSLVWATQSVGSVDYFLSGQQFGGAFLLFGVYAYTLSISGVVFLVQAFTLSRRGTVPRRVVLVAVTAAPVLVSLVYFFDLVVLPFDPTPATVGVVALVYATELSQGDEVTPLLRWVARDELLDRMKTAVIAVDRSGHVVDLNPAAAELLGTETEGAIGVNLREQLPELGDALVEHDPRWVGFVELTRRHRGTVRSYDVAVEPMSWGRNGRTEAVYGRLITFNDVTRIRRREEQLRVLNRMLRHNVRNDLNVVIGHAGFIEEDTSEHDGLGHHVDVVRDTSRKLVRQADKLGRVMREMDSRARAEVDLAAFLARIVHDSNDTFPNAQITLYADEDIIVESSPLLRIALEELVANAVEHNPDPEPEVEVSVTVDEDNGELLAVVEVVDDGPGIPLHEVTAVEVGDEGPLSHATGVGLWTVVWGVEQSGGRVRFRTRYSGTTVRVELPLVETRRLD